MKNVSVVTGLVGLLLALSGCNSGSGDEADGSTAIGASAAVSALSSAISAGLGTANISRESEEEVGWLDRLAPLFGEPSAHALVTTCTALANSDNCNSKTKSASYTDCPLTGGLTFSGTVTLSFSSVICALSSGNTLTRTLSLSRSTIGGGKVSTSSASHLDYRGNVIGGGTVTTNSSGIYSLAIPGLRKLRTSGGNNTIYDISVRTTSAFTISDPTSTSLTVSSGSMEVIHNVAQYVATVSANALAYSYSSCCYPTSGTLSVSYSGAASGSGSISFPSCGKATLTVGSASTSLTLIGCE